jgi:hypothetical protein
MKKLALIALATMGAACGPAVFASPEPQRYAINVRLVEAGKLIALPKLTTTAGTAATVASGDGPNKWSITVTPNPAASPSGKAALTLAADVEVWNGREIRRRVTTKVLLNEGETLSLKVRAQDTLPAVDVELRATRAPSA